MTRACRPLLLALGLLVLAGLGEAGAQERATLFLDPERQVVAPDAGDFEVRVMVDDVTGPNGLGGYTLLMVYDPAVIRGVAIADSGLVSSTDNAVLCPSSAIDNDAGRLGHFCFTIPLLAQPGPRVSDPQVLVRVTFEPVAEGSTTIDLSESALTDSQGNHLALTTAGGEVTVSSAPGGGAPGRTPGQDVAPGADGTTVAPGDASLPTTGDGPDGSGGPPVFVWVILGVIAGIAALAAAFFLRMRRRAA